MITRIMKIIFFLLVALMIVLLQFSFIPNLPLFFRDLNLSLMAVLLVLIFSGFQDAVLSALIFGFLMDSWHFSPFGIYLLSFLLVVLLAELMLNNWLTDRSLYSFTILALVNSLFFSIIWSLLNFLFSLGGGDNVFFLFSWSFLGTAISSAIWLAFLCGLSFLFLSAVSHRLKPVFLKKK